MRLLDSLRRMVSRSTSPRTVARRPPGRRATGGWLGIEVLEDRTVPSFVYKTIDVPGATLSEGLTASHIHNALWRSTLGYTLDEMCNADGDAADASPLIDDATLEQARNHVEQFLRPGGPLPAVRIGKQPYGVLPVVAPTFRPAPNDPFSGKLLGLLSLLRPFWLRGVKTIA